MSIARYAVTGGASIAAYDYAMNDGSMVSSVVKQLVSSASEGLPPGLLALPVSAPAMPSVSREVLDLSAKLDRLTDLSLGHLAERARGARFSTSTLIWAAGFAVGGLAIYAVATGRWWPTLTAKLENMETSVRAVDAKVDARASELSAAMAENHAEVMQAVATVGDSVREVSSSVERLEQRMQTVEEVEKENNRGTRARAQLGEPAQHMPRRAARPPRPRSPARPRRPVRAGIHILCEVVASNLDLRQCPAPVLKRLHDFSGSEYAVQPAQIEAHVQPVDRPMQPGPSSPNEAASSLMAYLTQPAASARP